MDGFWARNITTKYKAKFTLLADPSEDHHEQIPIVQKAFQKEGVGLAKAINDLGNPFQEDGEDLYSIDRKVVLLRRGFKLYTVYRQLAKHIVRN